MSNAGGPSSLRDLYSSPPTSWSFVPTASTNGSMSAGNTAPQPRVSEPSYQWASSRPKHNSIIDLSPGLRLEPNTPNAMLLLKAACASIVLNYAGGAVEMPWEVGRTLLQVQYVPRDAKAIEGYDGEAIEDIPSDDSGDNDEAYFADDGDSSPRARPTRPTDERGYVVRQSAADVAARPDYAIPVGTVSGVWAMIKQVARWKPEGWLGLWKGLLTSVIREFLSSTLQPVVHTILSSLLSPISTVPGELTFSQNHPILLPVLSHLVTGFMLSPLDLIRTRLIVQSSVARHRTYTGPIDAFAQIAQFEGGIRGMYLHSELLYPTLLECTLTPLIATCAPRYAARFLSHTLGLGSVTSRGVRVEITEESNPSLWALAQLMGACAGLIVTVPVETIRRRLQIQTRGSALPLKTCVETRPKRYVGIVDAFYSIITEERSDLPLKPSRKRKGKKHRRSMSTASEKGKQKEGEVIVDEDDENEGSWLRQSGVGQLYRGLGMRLCASLAVFILELLPTPSGIDDGWTEL